MVIYGSVGFAVGKFRAFLVFSTNISNKNSCYYKKSRIFA